MSGVTEFRTHESGITFAVDDVKPVDSGLRASKVNVALKKLVESEIEACYSYTVDCISRVSYHPLFQATEIAYSRHYPLTFSPDMIWITIVQGLGHHVKNHAEELRSRFVSHEGRMDICVKRTDFLPGSPENDWPGIVADFSDAVQGHVGEAAKAFVPAFSTTGLKERVAGQIAMLDAFQEYFRYLMYAICGIPEVTLEGTVEDWQRIREGVGALGDYDLDWWTSRLVPICDQFVCARKGEVDREFWQRMFRTEQAYGTLLIDGWLTHLVPYVKDNQKQFTRQNPCLLSDDESIDSGLLPKGISQAPLTCVSGEDRIAYDLLGGFVGVTQDPVTLAVRPEIGWAVRRSKKIEQVIAALDKHTTQPQPGGKTGFHRYTMLENLSAEFVRLYQEYDGAEVGYAEGWLQIRREEQLERIEGEMDRGDGFMSIECHWLLFADLPDGSQIGVFVPLSSDEAQPVVRCQGTPTVESPGEVIAGSIEEFLELSLTRSDMPYPLAPGFESSGPPLVGE